MEKGIKCQGCENILPTGDLRIRKFCSQKCRRNQEREKYKKSNPPLKDISGNKMDSLKVGTLGEISVMLDLIKKGYNVYRNVAYSGYCDLAIMHEKIMLRIEVKTGFYSAYGKLCYPGHKDKSRFDILAVWLKSGEVIYIPELPPISSLQPDDLGDPLA
jgi:hypothetical protein